jgi:predicted CopG family antitoxin
MNSNINNQPEIENQTLDEIINRYLFKKKTKIELEADRIYAEMMKEEELKKKKEEERLKRKEYIASFFILMFYLLYLKKKDINKFNKLKLTCSLLFNNTFDYYFNQYYKNKNFLLQLFSSPIFKCMTKL